MRVRSGHGAELPECGFVPILVLLIRTVEDGCPDFRKYPSERCDFGDEDSDY